MSVLLITITAILLTIFILVGVHELGHFIAARTFSIKVLRFSFGFGKPLIRFRDKLNTEYVISAIPLGGYVKLFDGREKNSPESEAHLSFNCQPAWKRLIVLFAGPLFNVLFAFFSLWMLLLIGVDHLKPSIGAVVPSSIAQQAGLQSDQVIHSIDGKRIHNWRDILLAVVFRLGDQDMMQITTTNTNPNDQHLTHQLDLSEWKVDRLKPNPLVALGILPPDQQSASQIQRHNALSGLLVASQQSYTYLKLNFVVLKKIITGKISLASIGGPISIFQGAYVSMLTGLKTYLFFLAMISLGLAIFNLLPIPGLDGGQIVFIIAEKLIGKPISIAVELLVFRLGIILLSVLAVILFSNDFLRFLT